MYMFDKIKKDQFFRDNQRTSTWLNKLTLEESDQLLVGLRRRKEWEKIVQGDYNDLCFYYCLADNIDKITFCASDVFMHFSSGRLLLYPKNKINLPTIPEIENRFKSLIEVLNKAKKEIDEIKIDIYYKPRRRR